jgi:tRNA A-37 threonylcarbamoyl transferase component Bud32
MSSVKDKSLLHTQVGGIGLQKYEQNDVSVETKTQLGLPADLQALQNNSHLKKSITTPVPPPAMGMPVPPPAMGMPVPPPPMATPVPPPPMATPVPPPAMATPVPQSESAHLAIDQNSKTILDDLQHKLNEPKSINSPHNSNQLIDGRYIIKNRLGEGGFGDVYLAEDTKLSNRPVAVKFMNFDLAQNKQALKLFQREAKILSRLNHSNIVTLLDSGVSEEGQPYLIIEYLEGKSLEDYISSNKWGLAVIEAIEVAIQLANALSEAHTIGVIHRDLKPDNVILQRLNSKNKYQTKLLDFGISKIQEGMLQTIADSHKTEGVLGTPYYMSPEQHIDSSQVGPRTDIYALGIILYEMITGCIPFSGTEYMEIAKKHIKAPLPQVCHDAPYSTVLNQVLSKMTAKKIAHRYQNIDETLIALEDILLTVKSINQHQVQIADEQENDPISDQKIAKTMMVDPSQQLRLLIISLLIISLLSLAAYYI